MKILVTLFFLSLQLVVFSQDVPMQFKGAPNGGNVLDIETTSTGDLYVVASGQGLWKSVDNGTSWTKLNVLSDNALVDIEIDGANNIYVNSSWFTFSSSDNGLTWTRRNSSSLVFGSNQNWTIRQIKRTGTSATSPMYALMSYNFQLLKQSVFRSTDNGASWTEVFSIPNLGERITTLAVNSSGNVFLSVNGEGIYKSSTGNLGTFALSNTGLPATPNPATRKQSLISLVGTLYGVFDNRVFRSLDNAANWVEITPLGGYTNLSSGLISGSGSNVYLITPTDFHFWNGATWTSTALGTLTTLNPNTIAAFKVFSTSLFYAGDNSGINSSTNGTSWSLKVDGLQALPISNTTQSLVTVNGNFYTQSNPVFSSVDDGVTWTRNSLLHATSFTQYTRIIPFSDGRFFAMSSSAGSFSSNNYGETWTAETPPATTPFLTNDIDIIYAYATPTSVYKSIDRGVTWTSHTITGLPTSFFLNTGNSYFYADGHLYFALTDQSVSPNAVRFYKVNVLTWVASLIPSPPLAVTYTASSESIAKYGNRLYIASRNGTVNQLSVSTNEGLTWTTTNVPGIVNANFFLTQSGYPVFITNTGLGRISRDAGSTWLSINLGFGSSDSFNPRSALTDDEGYLFLMFDAKGFYKSDEKIVLPEAPTNLTLVGSTFREIRLEADDNSLNEEYFTIETSVGNNTSYDSVARILTSNFSKLLLFLNTVPETTYYVRLKAVNSAGSSAYSNELMVTTPSVCPTPIPSGRSWSLTTLNESGLGVRVSTNVTLTSSRFDEYTFSASSITGSSPSWPSPYPVTGASGTLTVNCGSVFTNFSGTNYVMDGNGTWDANTNTITIKWKVNQSALTATPFSETSVLTLNATDPIPNLATQPFVAVSASNAILVSWTGYPNYASQMIVERATVSTGPWTEVGRQLAPKVLLEDKTTTFVEGQTYFYRLRGSNTTGQGVNSVTTSLVFTKPLFETIATLTLASYSSRPSTAWVDVNNDGFDDLFYSNNSAANLASFLMNKGDGTFEVKPFGESSQVQYFYSKFGDFNNDGNIDMVSQVRDFNGGSKFYNEIFSGDGQGNFTSIYTSPLNAVSPNGQVQIMDYNRDGLLDVILGSNKTTGTTTEYTLYMLQNMGNNMFQKAFDFFTNETNAAAIDFSIIDLNTDGILDLFVTGLFDAATNNIRFYQGNANHTFTLTTAPSFPSLASTTTILSHEWGDIDNDGDLDLLLALNAANPARALYRNNGNGTFTNFSSSAIAEVNLGSSSAATFGDFNNDGALDIVANHSVSGLPTAPQGYIFLSNLNQNPAAFASAAGSNTFTKKEGEVATNYFVANNGYNLSDFDKDGFLDMSSSWSDPDGRIFKNNKLGTGNWVGVKLVGVQSNRSAIGSRIRVTAGSSTRQRLVSAIAGGVFIGQHSLVQHVGLGSYTGALVVEVTWPTGKKQVVSVSAVNQFITITEDTEGPILSNLLPAPAATNVSSSTQLQLTLSEENVAVAGKRIVLTKKATPIVEVFSQQVTAGVKTGNTYAFTLPSKLEQGVEYQVSIEEGAFKDVFQNPSLGILTGVWSFTVGQGPQLTALSPLNNAVSVNTNTKLDLTFNGPVTGVAGKFLNVFRQSDQVNAVTSIEASTAVITANTASFILPTKLSLNTQYTVSLDAAAFKDVVQNESSAIMAGTAWLFTTSPGPQVSSYQPTFNATNIANNQSLSLTFNGNVTAVSGKFIRVDNGATNILTIDASTASITNNVVTIAAPAGNWPFLSTLSVKIDQGAFIDNAGNDFAGIAGTAWSFTIVEAPDVTAPSITYNPALISVLDKGFSTTDVKVTATDAKGVVRVVMYHRKLTELTAPKTIALTVPPSSGNDWTFQVTNTMTDDMGFEYYFEAFDLAGNKTRNPLAENSFHKSSIRFTTSNAPKLTLSGEGNLNSWRIISVPYQLENGNFQIADVLQTFGAAGADTWRLIRYDKSGATERWLEFPAFSAFERGKGYFINSLGLKEAVFNNAVAPNFDRNNLEKINLVAGWNQIGNPYTVAINWEDVRAFNGAASNVGGLKLFTNGQYTNGTTLQPGQGGFVLVGTATTVDIPFLGQTQAGARTEQTEFGTDLSANSWLLPITIEHDYISNDMAGIGMHSEASIDKDQFDDFHAPRFLGYSEINFEHQAYTQMGFARDIVPTAESFVWSFAVNSNLEGMASIKWDNTAFGNNDKQLVLVDEANLTVIDMRSINHYTFEPSESKKFKIYFGKQVMEQIGLETFSVSNAYPNPTTGETKIRFSLPQNGGENQLVDIEAKDVMGKHLSTISQNRLQSGFHEVSINAANLQAVDGMLLIAITVSNDLGKSQKQIKVIVKK